MWGEFRGNKQLVSYQLAETSLLGYYRDYFIEVLSGMLGR